MRWKPAPNAFDTTLESPVRGGLPISGQFPRVDDVPRVRVFTALYPPDISVCYQEDNELPSQKVSDA